MRNLIEDVILTSCLNRIMRGQWLILESLVTVIDERCQYYGSHNANR